MAWCGRTVTGGTCICGGTAIGTLSRIIKAKEEEIAFAMAAIFLFDILADFSYPYLIEALGFTPNSSLSLPAPPSTIPPP